MTLKSNKNEPAVVLEPVSSVRTALSDLYLEHLLQSKPKTDKVCCHLQCLFICVTFSCPRSWCYTSMFVSGEAERCFCFPTISLKIDPVVFL